MTKMTVFFVNWKTYASQLSGSPMGFLLPTKSAFKVHPGKGNNWLFVRSKGVFIPLDKDLSKTAHTYVQEVPQGLDAQMDQLSF